MILETDTNRESHKLVVLSKKLASSASTTLETMLISMRTKVFVSNRPKSFVVTLKKKLPILVTILTPILEKLLVLALKYPTNPNNKERNWRGILLKIKKSLSSSEIVTTKEDISKKKKRGDDLPSILEAKEVNFDETFVNHDDQMVATDAKRCSKSVKRACVSGNDKGSSSKKGKKAIENHEPPHRYGKGKYHLKNHDVPSGEFVFFLKIDLILI